MTNAHRLLLSIPLLCFSLILGTSLWRGARRSLYRKKCGNYFIFLTGWLATDLLSSVASTPFAIRYLFGMRMAWLECLVIAAFLATVEFHRAERLLPSRWKRVIYIVPAGIFLLALASPLIDFASPTLVGLIQGIRRYAAFTYTVGLPVYAFASAALTCNRIRRTYRSGFGFLAICLFLLIGSGFMELALPFSDGLDFPLICCVCGGGFLSLSAAMHDQPNYRLMERNEVFHRLDKGICILNEHGLIIDSNTAAARILRLEGGGHCVFDDYLNDLCRRGLITRRKLDNQLGEDLITLDGPFPVMYQLRSYPVKLSDSPAIGRYIVLMDVTNRRLYAERLELLSGVDFLTGLPNGVRCRQLLRDFDRTENLPFSAVLCTVENLRRINDEYGQYEGDLLLKTAAEAMGDACPKGGLVARVSGSMFIMMLPHCDRWRANEIAAAIRSAYSTSAPVSARLILQAVTKTSASENLGILLSDATEQVALSRRTIHPEKEVIGV